MKRWLAIIGIWLIGLSACNGGGASPANGNTATAVPLTSSPPAAEPLPATAVPPTFTTAPELAPSPSPTAPPAVSATATAVITAANTAEVSLAGAGELTLQGTLLLPAGVGPHPGVILLHMLGSNRQAWLQTELPQALQAAGYAVLALDMRGHGDTGGNQDWALAAADMPLVYDYFTGLEAVDGRATAVVGASIGANMALTAGAAIPAIDTVVLLSPGLDYRGVTTEDKIAAYGQRPLLIVASEEDSYAADSSRDLQELAAGEAELVLYNGAGHGTAMFFAESTLTPTILEWLRRMAFK